MVMGWSVVPIALGALAVVWAGEGCSFGAGTQLSFPASLGPLGQMLEVAGGSLRLRGGFDEYGGGGGGYEGAGDRFCTGPPLPMVPCTLFFLVRLLFLSSAPAPRLPRARIDRTHLLVVQRLTCDMAPSRPWLPRPNVSLSFGLFCVGRHGLETLRRLIHRSVPPRC